MREKKQGGLHCFFSFFVVYLVERTNVYVSCAMKWKMQHLDGGKPKWNATYTMYWKSAVF